MKKRNTLFRFAGLLLAFGIATSAHAQNTSPFWSLAGNSTADNNSKLGTTNAIPLRLFTNNQPRAYIATDGKFGIGTTSPQQLFHVEGSTLLSIFVSTSPLSSISGSGMIGYTKFLPTAANQRLGYFLLGSRGGAENNYNAAGMVGYAAGAWTAGSSYPAYLAFETTPSGSATRSERLRIDQNGNVGVGTTSPVNKLDVAGLNNWDVTNTEGDVRIGNSTYRLKIGVATSGGGAGDVRIRAVGGTNRLMLGTADNLAIDGTGNVGIGTITPDNKLHVSKGNAGTVTADANAPLVVENSTNSYINLLAPDNAETGVLFGKPASNVSGGIVYNTGSNLNGLQFRTNGNIPRMVVSNTGNVGIGTLTPDKKLVVTATPPDQEPVAIIKNLANNGLNDGLYIQAGTNGGSGSWFASFLRPDETQIGRIEQADATHVAYLTTSDKRLKANIRETKFSLADVNKIQVKDYNYIDSKTNQTGFLAQQLYEVFPEAVSKGGDDPKKRPWMVDYGRITPLLVKAIQELSKKDEELEKKTSEIEQLKKELAEVKQAINNLAGKQGITALTGGALLQNVPNPVRGTTTINYSLPEGANSAKLLLTDGLGRTVKVMQLTTSGVVNINVAALSAGVYNYSLVVDGKLLQTKKMTVEK